MKILHVTSDNTPGGIQKAFKNYVAALAPLSEFENFFLEIVLGNNLVYRKIFY